MAYPVLARYPQGRILKEIKVIFIYTLAKCNILKFRNREKTDGVEFCLFVCLLLLFVWVFFVGFLFWWWWPLGLGFCFVLFFVGGGGCSLFAFVVVLFCFV